MSAAPGRRLLRRLIVSPLIVAVSIACLAMMQTPAPTPTASAEGVEGATITSWTVGPVEAPVRFRGVSAVSDTVAWASGTKGTIVRTADGGRTWQTLSIPGTEALDFRDIDAIDLRTAYALSIGPGEASRIYKTIDEGHSWQLQYTNHDPKAFFDAMTFADASHGVVMSDSVDGQFVIMLTHDGGATWARAPREGLPPALPNEGAFAASGTNVALVGADRIWIGTGAAGTARVLRSGDGGRTWAVSSTPLVSGASAGIFSITFRDAMHGVIVGGDYRKEGDATDNVAITEDGGVTWRLVREHGLSGFRSAVAYVPGAPTPTLLAVGLAGADLSRDSGRSWRPFRLEGLHTLSFAAGGRKDAKGASGVTGASGATGWGAGERGRIVRIEGLASRGAAK
jgi:photosystem II stability/assembly factor-like uncharacterized protein